MRIISLVPSWTETLMECGIEPIARTRFCIHPKTPIPVVGGTKNVDWDKVKALKPDLLILDQQENPKSFSEVGIPFWASNVTNGVALTQGLQELAEILKNEPLHEWAKRCEEIWQQPDLIYKGGSFPGMLEMLKGWSPEVQMTYVIWKNPWMAVSPDTYIGSVLKKLGFKIKTWGEGQKLYPEFDLINDGAHAYLFSSEPFPFVQKKEELMKLGVQGALVDGESFSWYGVRSIKFLQKALGLPNL